MIVYILSDPRDNEFILTTNRDVVMAARKAARYAAEPLEVFSWDTETTRLFTIAPRYREDQGPEFQQDDGAPDSP